MMTQITEGKMMDLESTQNLIRQGKVLVISGNDALLSQLPRGSWIGGTANYFYIKGEGGKVEQNQLFVSDFSAEMSNFKILTYSKESIHRVCLNGFENGINFLILPTFSDIHVSFGLNAPYYEKQYINPLIGLIAGGDFDETLNGRRAKIFSGITGESYTEYGVVLHGSLPQNKVARLEIVNVFEPDENQSVIEVDKTSFRVENCKIDGKPRNLYDFFKEIHWDIRYPIVTDYHGAIINASILKEDEQNRSVLFTAPLFKGKKYTFSKKFDSYANLFKERVKTAFEKEKRIIYNCNCLYNYFYGELEKNDIGLTGTTSWGEIGFHLMNQTFTYLAVDEY